MSKNTQKHLTLLKVMYSPKSTRAELLAVQKATSSDQMTETEQVEFADFMHRVGNLHIELNHEMDLELTRMADSFPNETDPRKWDASDWLVFDMAVDGHPFQAIYTTYAKQEDNLHLIWAEIESRL